MSPRARQVLDDALALSPMERAELVEKILDSFPFRGREETDALWTEEAEDRIDAFDRGELEARPARAVFARIEGNPD